MGGQKEPVEKFAELLLSHARDFVEDEGLPKYRLPNWIDGCDIKTGKIDNTYIIQFKPNNKDTTSYFGQVMSDTCLFLDISQESPEEQTSPIAPVGWTSGDAITIFGTQNGSGITDTGETPRIFEFPNDGIHLPVFLVHIFMKYKPNEYVANAGVVPFGVFIHESDLAYRDDLFEMCISEIETILSHIFASDIGDYYQSRDSKETALTIGRDRSVIVLGSYSDTEKPDLVETRDLIRSRGYHAELVEELDEHPMMSLQEKVNHWTSASRFSVMIDDKPSGHLTEYEIAKENRTILALLRPKNSGSSWTFGDEPIVDINHINVFEYNETPLEVVDEAIDWAESIAQKRVESYNEHYPWRASE